MKILEGLFDHMVLQRHRGNASEAVFSGECDGPGVVRVSVRKGRRRVRCKKAPVRGAPSSN